jgi:hypothetical protein
VSSQPRPFSPSRRRQWRPTTSRFSSRQGTKGGEARCDIAQRDWQAPPKPHSCHLDYGNGLEVTKHGKGQFTCAGDTVLGQGPVLNYGDAINFGHYKCKSKTSGVRCRNRQSGHGFKISKERAVRF